MSNKLRKCTMCGTYINTSEEQPQSTCKCCGTKFISSNLELYNNAMFDESSYNPLDEKSIVPKSLFEELLSLEKAKDDKSLYNLALEVVEKYSSDASAYFITAIALGNLFLRRTLNDTNLEECIIFSDEKSNITLNKKKIYDFFDTASKLDKGANAEKIQKYIKAFDYMSNFAYLDNAINNMSKYVKSKNKIHLLYGENAVEYTDKELEKINAVETQKKIKTEIENGTRKKEPFFSKNIFLSTMLLVCLSVVLAPVVFLFIPVSKIWIKTNWISWTVIVVIAVLFLFARLGVLIEKNGEENITGLESIKQKDSKNIKGLIETSEKYRKNYDEDYWWMFDFESLDNEEEFLTKAYSKYIVIFKMLKTDLINNSVKVEDINGYTLWDRYYNILKYKEEWLNQENK